MHCTAMLYSVWWIHRTNPPPPGGTLVHNCDCNPTPEDATAGIHAPDCASHTGPADDPSDHYQQ
ncbi:hypothetical protein B0E37_01709 [Streptomyces sp. MH192]|nr:hypothetical protein [Streptomyces sp. MH192]MCF0098806.1 hypothetical protein [Streptomyces sp. MH191]